MFGSPLPYRDIDDWCSYVAGEYFDDQERRVEPHVVFKTKYQIDACDACDACDGQTSR